MERLSIGYLTKGHFDAPPSTYKVAVPRPVETIIDDTSQLTSDEGHSDSLPFT